MYDGNRWVLARAGDSLYIPMGGVHGFRALSDEPSSMLILFGPGAPREQYFRELAAIRDNGRTAWPGGSSRGREFLPAGPGHVSRAPAGVGPQRQR